MDGIGGSRLRVAIIVAIGLAAGALTVLQLAVWAMATSHPGLAGEVMIRQRLVALSCSAGTVVVIVASGFRRRLSGNRLACLLAFACASLGCGGVLVFRDSRRWDTVSVALAGVAVVSLVAAALTLAVSR